MKKEKMEMFFKRLPNEGLLELQEILNQELAKRSVSSRYIKSNFGSEMCTSGNAERISLRHSRDKFCESTLPKELRSGKNTKNDNKCVS